MRRLALRRVAGALLAAAALVATLPPAAAAEDVAALLRDGVSSIDAPGVPGPLVVTGGDAVAVVVGGPAGEPVAAAGRFGKGRVVALGHNGYLSPAARKSGDTARFLDNALRWAAGDRKSTTVGLLRDDLRGSLEGAGFRVVVRPVPAAAGDLEGVDVLLVDVHALEGAAGDAVAAHLRRGGGLVAGGLGWGWLQLHPGRTLDDHPGNRLLAGVGILWADGTLARTAPAGFKVADGDVAAAHGVRALEVIHAVQRGGKSPGDDVLRQASAVALRATRTLPDDDRTLLPVLRKLAAGDLPVPTAEKPVGPDAPLSRVLAALDVRDWATVPPARVRVHRSAAAFPGLPEPGAKPVDATCTVDPTLPRWQSTGLYAPPGTVIRVTLPADAAGAGMTLRIGAHTDTLWDVPEWKRFPEISLSVPLERVVTEIASPFGGLLFLEMPAARDGGPVAVRIEGAVAAPRFVLGTTTAAEWKSMLRRPAAPWAELATDRVVLVVPTEEARRVADPEGLMRFWNEVMDGCADLAGIPRERASPERYCADVQISVGYMHAGYPIMVQLDAPGFMLDLDGMRHGRNAWGPFHEMGHNHQRPDWTFEGTVEVTNNLFSLYLMETLCDVPHDRAHPAYPVRADALRVYLDSGPDFARWKRDPFLALTMYGQVQEAFGWEPFRKVFAEYAALPDGERPATDDAKRDQWLVRLSRAVGRDLGPFFRVWGVPVSDAARQKIADLPEWMPEDLTR